LAITSATGLTALQGLGGIGGEAIGCSAAEAGPEEDAAVPEFLALGGMADLQGASDEADCWVLRVAFELRLCLFWANWTRGRLCLSWATPLLER